MSQDQAKELMWPIDYYVRRRIQENPGISSEDPQIYFANVMWVLMFDISATVTKCRLDNLHKEMDLPGKPVELVEPEKKPPLGFRENRCPRHEQEARKAIPNPQTLSRALETQTADAAATAAPSSNHTTQTSFWGIGRGREQRVEILNSTSASDQTIRKGPNKSNFPPFWAPYATKAPRTEKQRAIDSEIMVSNGKPDGSAIKNLIGMAEFTGVQLTRIGEPIHAFSIESVITSSAEGKEGTSDYITIYPALEISDLVPRSSRIIILPAATTSSENRTY
ncbi:hypothetical protein AYI69_g6250 [Smittium culicis]|uniref:Uncharacterized protein n=1 Tax=Smittium culicis TaxID=133412 RepID=A0A1R1Y0F3_9FUNG|nr:hypothetical protein AYI69_g6250 [Smittium culicis]